MANITEKKKAAYAQALAAIQLAEVGTQTDNQEYVITVDVDGQEFYVAFKGTVKDTKGTKTRPGYSLESALAAFEEKKAAAAERGATKAAKATEADTEE